MFWILIFREFTSQKFLQMHLPYVCQTITFKPQALATILPLGAVRPLGTAGAVLKHFFIRRCTPNKLAIRVLHQFTDPLPVQGPVYKGI